MKPEVKNSMEFSSKKLAMIAVMAATISGGKLALLLLPANIEIVTLLCALYGYAFGFMGLAATYIFILCETLILGFGTWVPLYLIYWPLVTIIFLTLGKFKIKNRVVLTAAAIVITIFFGVLSSLIDVGLFMGEFDRFWQRFSVIYVRGIAFYLAQITCNAAFFPVLFRPLSEALTRIRARQAR